MPILTNRILYHGQSPLFFFDSLNNCTNNLCQVIEAAAAITITIEAIDLDVYAK